MSMAYESKRAGHDVRNQKIQDARDVTTCTCGHSNLHHAFGRNPERTWPDGSKIGMGQCASCPCMAFTDAAR